MGLIQSPRFPVLLPLLYQYSAGSARDRPGSFSFSPKRKGQPAASLFDFSVFVFPSPLDTAAAEGVSLKSPKHRKRKFHCPVFSKRGARSRLPPRVLRPGGARPGSTKVATGDRRRTLSTGELRPLATPLRGVNFYLAASFANAKLDRVSCTKCNLTRAHIPKGMLIPNLLRKGVPKGQSPFGKLNLEKRNPPPMPGGHLPPLGRSMGGGRGGNLSERNPLRHRSAMTPPPTGEAASLFEGGATPLA